MRMGAPTCGPFTKSRSDYDLASPSPVAPYFMQVYNSASSVPYVIDAGLGASFVRYTAIAHGY